MPSRHVLVLIRHAEAYKNVRLQHGGPGSGLTPKGEGQASAIAHVFAGWRLFNPHVKAIAKPQCLQTAKRLLGECQVSDLEVVDFPTFHLGVVDGLSDLEVETLSPEISRLLRRWREGEIEACELRAIEGVTDPSCYFVRGQLFVSQLKSALECRDVVVVATRSVLVVLANILNGNTPDPGGGYREIVWGNCEYVRYVHMPNGGFALSKEFTNVRQFT